MRFYGDLCEGIGLYGAQEAFGQARFPQTLPENHFTGISPFPEKSLGPPGPLVGSLLAPDQLALVGQLLSFPESDERRVLVV